MQWVRHGIFWLFVLLLMTACQEPPQPRHLQIPAMGTLVDVVLYDVPPAQAEQARIRLGRLLFDFGHDWWAWGDGRLARLNQQLSQTGHAELPDDMADLIAEARQLAQLSGGCFNPAVGPLVRLWGFHSAPRDPHAPPPDAHAIAALLPVPDMQAIHLDHHQISAPRGTWIDLGGYAKGRAVDLAVAELRRLGIHNAIVNAGGDLRAIGSAGNRPWRIGIRNPRGEGAIASLTVEDNESVFTSGDYERTFIYHDQRYHHILNPRTGYPAQGTESVTVVDTRAAWADAAATALFVAGPEHWPQVATALGVKQVLLIDHQGRFHMTAELAQRIRLETAQPPPVIIQALPTAAEQLKLCS